MHRLALVHGNRKVTGTNVRMALVDERQSTDKDVAEPPRILVFALITDIVSKFDTWTHFGVYKSLHICPVVVV